MPKGIAQAGIAPIGIFSVPNGCSTVSRRQRCALGGRCTADFRFVTGGGFWSATGRCCRKSLLQKTLSNIDSLKRKYAVSIQKAVWLDSIITKFNSTVLHRVLFRQHRSK